MMCCQFIFQPGTYDDDFLRLDQSVAQLARFPQDRQAKDQVARWYNGYRIVISEVTATYGDGRLTE